MRARIFKIGVNLSFNSPSGKSLMKTGARLNSTLSEISLFVSLRKYSLLPDECKKPLGSSGLLFDGIFIGQLLNDLLFIMAVRQVEFQVVDHNLILEKAVSLMMKLSLGFAFVF
jgi:hypothetical protein